MASPAELRAKLLAKRASQQEETKRRGEIHESARSATRHMVMLGYNFDDILELLKSEVSEEYLNDMFRSVGIARKRKHSHKHPETAFGAARWLDHEDNFVIRLDEGLSTDDEPSLSDVEVETKEPLNNREAELGSVAGGANANADAKSDVSAKSDIDTNAVNADEIVDAAAAENGEKSEYGVENAENSGENAVVDAGNSAKNEAVYLEANAGENAVANANPNVTNAQENVDLDGMPQDPTVVRGPPLVDEAMEVDGDARGPSADQATASFETPAETVAGEASQFAGNDQATNSEMVVDSEPSARSPETRAEPGPADQALANPTRDRQVGSPVELDEPKNDKEDVAEPPKVTMPDEEAVQRELDKVQAQIRQVQELKLARDAQREAIADMNRRNMELRDIASRRALLIQKRDTLNVANAARKVDDLERRLELARKHMFNTRHQLEEVDREALELEKQELKLREELSRPRPAVTANVRAQEEASPSHVEAPAEREQPKFQYPVPTAAQSPLRAFNSFRMCPSLGISHWFSKSFNGCFVEDLSSREMCPDEIRGKSHKTPRGDCEYVHFSDFDVAPLEICEYMASRQIDRPGYREGLVQALKTHLPAETSPEYIAASIIGFSRKYDPSQILDWQGWGVERPL